MACCRPSRPAEEPVGSQRALSGRRQVPRALCLITLCSCILLRRSDSCFATRAGAARAVLAATARRAATPASITISQKMSELDERVKAVEKPEEELYWRVLAYCTACRTPWCKLPWRKHTCLKGDAKAEGTQGKRCDMSWEAYTDILTKSVPLISHKKAQILTRECWQQGDADPSGIGVVTVCIVPKVAAEEYGASLGRNGIQASVVPDSFYKGPKNDT
mmetsp:Transcript_28461/g.45953  ORF Transcript_28461/g.45953 Transcript_28461/m.45953 type:complete len:219 (-) Transcript_28461:102-758(-)